MSAFTIALLRFETKLKYQSYANINLENLPLSTFHFES